MEKNIGKLYLCATPIGNLEDITLRVLNTFRSVDLIACEDTRRTIKLLNHFNIKKPLTSYYEHNKTEKGKYLIEKLKNGENIALVSDAGTPAISDPGEELVKECIDNGIEVIALPGACAAVVAITCSGMDTGRFSFEGFLTVNKRKRKIHLSEICSDTRTLVFYEAPHKLITTLKEMQSVLGDRKIVIGRELTKKFEEIIRTSISEAIKLFEERSPKGEFVIIIEGKNKSKEKESTILDMPLSEHLKLYLEQGIDQKEAIKRIAKDKGVPKRDIYNMVCLKRN